MWALLMRGRKEKCQIDSVPRGFRTSCGLHWSVAMQMWMQMQMQVHLNDQKTKQRKRGLLMAAMLVLVEYVMAKWTRTRR